jgi:tetratricopeptide (TPR) repeat protein
LEYRRAINSDPRNIDIRLKLAQLYSKRKMYTQSIGELERAQAIAPGSDAVRRELANVYTQKGAPEKAAAVYANQADSNPKDIASRLSAGDYYLQQNMLQDAEKQYRLAAQADPASPVPHDRLAMFFASQLKFTESCAEVDQLQRLDQKPDLKAFLDRYSRLKGYADGELKSILADYDAGATAFANHKMTREAYYDYVRKVSARIEPVAHYLDVLAPPDSAATSHRHRTLGCSLLSQACTHLMRYLETNKSSEMDSATIFISEARKHITQAG